MGLELKGSEDNERQIYIGPPQCVNLVVAMDATQHGCLRRNITALTFEALHGGWGDEDAVLPSPALHTGDGSLAPAS